jgi:hypothetical protein
LVEADLVAVPDSDMLRRGIPSRAGIDKVYTELLELFHEDRALLYTPLSPFAVFLLVSGKPIRSTDANEERLIPSSAASFHNSKWEPHAIFQGFASILVIPHIGDRRKEGMKQVPMCTMNFDEVI